MDTQRIHNQRRKRPQVLSVNAIKDLQQVFLLEKGIIITPEQAQLEGLRFLNFMKHIIKPIPNGDTNYGKK